MKFFQERYISLLKSFCEKRKVCSSFWEADQQIISCRGLYSGKNQKPGLIERTVSSVLKAAALMFQFTSTESMFLYFYIISEFVSLHNVA